MDSFLTPEILNEKDQKMKQNQEKAPIIRMGSGCSSISKEEATYMI